MQPRSARVDDVFDEDLKRALAMSLEEVDSHTRQASYTPAPPLQQFSNSVHKKSEQKAPQEEDDDDLKAAIAASLADMEGQKKKHTAAIKQNADVAKYNMKRSDNELTPAEAENINLFSTLVDRLQSQPPGTVLREPQLQELYGSIGPLRPKIARSFGETMSKHDALLDLHAKLSTVVRHYDRMLEDRLSNTYSNHNISGYSNAPQLYTNQGPYPVIDSSHVTQSNDAETFYSNDPRMASTAPLQSQPTYSPAPNTASGIHRGANTNIGYPSLDSHHHHSSFSQQQSPAPPLSTNDWQSNHPKAPGASTHYEDPNNILRTTSGPPVAQVQTENREAHLHYAPTPPTAHQYANNNQQSVPYPPQAQVPQYGSPEHAQVIGTDSQTAHHVAASQQYSQATHNYSHGSPQMQSFATYAQQATPDIAKDPRYQAAIPQQHNAVARQPSIVQPTQAPSFYQTEPTQHRHIADSKTQSQDPTTIGTNITPYSFPSVPQHVPEQQVVEEALIEL